MTSTYTTNKSIEKPAYNDYASNATGWSSPINTDWDIIDAALGGVTIKNPTGVAAGTYALSLSEYQKLTIVFGTSVTGVAALSGNLVYTVPAGVGGQWFMYNNTSGSYTVTIAQASGGGLTVLLPQGARTLVYSDGTNFWTLSPTNVAPPGASGQVVYNLSGALAGSANMTFDGTTLTASALASTGNITSGGTINGNTVSGGTVSASSTMTTPSLTVSGAIAADTVTATGAVTAYSDRSLKKDISTIRDALDKVKAMRGVNFTMINSGEVNIGVIAQEVQEVIPEVIRNNNGMLSVAYGNLTAVLIEAVKELSARLDAIEGRLP
jgi:hypothetical protein